MAHRHELAAAEWARVAPLLPARATSGTYYADHRRRVLNGMLDRLATGRAWCDLPERYGPWPTVASRQRRWTREGLWDRVLAALQRDIDAAARIDWSSLTGAGCGSPSRSAPGRRTKASTPRACSRRGASRAARRAGRAGAPRRSPSSSSP